MSTVRPPARGSPSDFTECEQRGAYFDGDNVIATKKDVNVLERGSEVAKMAEFQSLLDFPPAPKLDPATGKLDPAKASDSEKAGQAIFFGKGTCVSCHQPPFYRRPWVLARSRRSRCEASRTHRLTCTTAGC